MLTLLVPIFIMFIILIFFITFYILYSFIIIIIFPRLFIACSHCVFFRCPPTLTHSSPPPLSACILSAPFVPRLPAHR